MNPFQRTRTKASERAGLHIRRMQRERAGIVSQGDNLFRRALNQQYGALIERHVDGARNASQALRSLQGASPNTDAIERGMERFYLEAARRFGTVGEEAVTGDKHRTKSDVYEREMREYLQTVGGQKITQISETTRSDIMRIITRRAEDDQGIDRIARALRDQIDVVSLARGRMISRTEVIPASNKAVDVGARQANIQLEKEWITATDGREREWHNDADGQVVDMDAAFVVKGERLDFPGDTSHGASAENVINCRCAHAPIPKE